MLTIKLSFFVKNSGAIMAIIFDGCLQPCDTVTVTV